MFLLNPIALRMAKTPGSFDHSECSSVKEPQKLDPPYKRDHDFLGLTPSYSRINMVWYDKKNFISCNIAIEDDWVPVEGKLLFHVHFQLT